MQQLLSIMTIGAALAVGSAAQAQEITKPRQQTKMATCNKEAVGKKGDERKSFMKICLSAKKDEQQRKS